MGNPSGVNRPATWVDLLRRRAAEGTSQPSYTFLGNGEQPEVEWSYAQLDRQARRIAAHLQQSDATGQPVLVLFRPGLEFVAAFFGCLYAGAIAVPLDLPRPRRDCGRWRAVLEDSTARFVLTEQAVASTWANSALPGSETVNWMVTEEIPEGLAESWQPPPIDSGSLAFLQYTSGSTAQPKGVMVRHANLLANATSIQQAFGQDANSTLVSWLPLFHDMGLIGVVLQSAFLGSRCVLMAPEAFLLRPFRWLQAISRFRAHTSGAPNFAYEWCVRRITAEQREELDLRHWKVAFNGAEPVRQATLDRFAATFASCGFQRRAFHPCYGLAEATLFVTGGQPSAVPPTISSGPSVLRSDERSGEAASPGRTLVSCGRTWGPHRIQIVDPETALPCPPDTIGEVWVSGPSVAAGYWNRPADTDSTFQARLADTGEGPFLRTGDLGVIHDGNLFLTGRIKDVLICGGRKHHAEDIEQTVEQCLAEVPPGGCAAFSVEDDQEEHLVIAVELERSRGEPIRREDLCCAIRAAVARHHDVRVHDIVFLRRGKLLRTSSGKVQRHACRTAYLNANRDETETEHEPNLRREFPVASAS